jgi:hypothetical protein
MNIFKILSSGDSKLKEPSVSAFLGFLLNPRESHGLSSKFLEHILKVTIHKDKDTYKGLFLNDKIKNLSIQFDVEKDLEVKVKSDKEGRSDIDILISMFDKKEYTEIPKPKYIFSIENKINKNAINKEKTQLSKQLFGLIKYLEEEYEIKKDDDNFPHIGIIFLTPDDCDGANGELQNLKEKIENAELIDKVSSSHLLWKNKNQDSDEDSAYSILSDLLKKESSGLIEPIHEYTKYTIKAFIQFIESNFQSASDDRDEDEEGKYKKTLIYDETKIKEGLEKIEKKDLIKKIHDDILKTFNPKDYRYAPKQKRISYSINGSYAKRGIFLQIIGKINNLLFLLRKDEKDIIDDDCEHVNKDYLYKYEVEDYNSYESRGKDLVQRSYEYVKTLNI